MNLFRTENIFKMEQKGNIIEIGKWKGINPKKEPLTIQKLKELTNSPEMSDAEAQEIIFSIEALVSILVQFQYEEELKAKQNQETNLKQAA
jgi:hypothetical protein